MQYIRRMDTERVIAAFSPGEEFADIIAWQSILVSRGELRDEGTCSTRETHLSPRHGIATGSRDAIAI